ncbi:MAG: amidohydrolase family protein [Armatimonadota bacterium]|nr:amidohydrolase family protein [Armatimonadota bacterium]
MIVDCHTHIGIAGEHVGGAILEDLLRVWGKPLWNASPEEHWTAMAGVDRAIVLAFDAPRIGLVVPNEYVAAYVARHRDKLIGFASVDPARPRAPQILEDAVRRLGMRGLKIAPIYQHFDPWSTDAYALYEAADGLGIPVIWHQGTTFVRDAPLVHARPVLLDDIARRFPDLRMWIAHMGHPWCDEMIAVVRKHPHVYADMSAIFPRPMQFYFALASAVEYGVAHKIFFGTDFPFTTVEASIAALRGINRVVEGTGLPRIGDEVVEGIIHRDALELLGIEPARRAASGGRHA